MYNAKITITEHRDEVVIVNNKDRKTQNHNRAIGCTIQSENESIDRRYTEIWNMWGNP